MLILIKKINKNFQQPKNPSKPPQNIQKSLNKKPQLHSTATFKHTFSLIQKKSLILKWIAFFSCAAGLVHGNSITMKSRCLTYRNLCNYFTHISYCRAYRMTLNAARRCLSRKNILEIGWHVLREIFADFDVNRVHWT